MNNVINYKDVFARLLPLLQGGIANEKQIKMAKKLVEWNNYEVESTLK